MKDRFLWKSIDHIFHFDTIILFGCYYPTKEEREKQTDTYNDMKFGKKCGDCDGR